MSNLIVGIISGIVGAVAVLYGFSIRDSQLIIIGGICVVISNQHLGIGG